LKTSSIPLIRLHIKGSRAATVYTRNLKIVKVLKLKIKWKKKQLKKGKRKKEDGERVIKNMG
jgi:hypothetical protein